MQSSRPRVITTLVVASGVVVIVVVGTVIQRDGLEWWSIWRLRSQSVEVRSRATDHLVDMGSVKAIPALMRAFSLDLRDFEEKSGEDFFATMKNLYGQISRREQEIASLRETLRGANVKTVFVQGQIGSVRSEIATLNEWIRQALGLRNLPSYRAVNRIASKAGPAVVARLDRLLESSGWQTRWLTVHLLEDLRLPESTSSVEDAVLDENEHVRNAAAAALHELNRTKHPNAG